MTPAEFKAARLALGLTQGQLAGVLGYTPKSGRSHVGIFELASGNARQVPPQVRRLLEAYLDGYRPPDWPVGETFKD